MSWTNQFENRDPKSVDDEIKKLQAGRSDLKRLSRLLDEAVRIPILNIKIGLDAIIGFIPIIGDAVGALLSLYLVFRAYRLGTPPKVIMRMMINVGLEFLIGLVPVLGDYFDIIWRANIKNYELFDAHVNQQLVRLGVAPVDHTPDGKRSQSVATIAVAILLLLLLSYAIYHFQLLPQAQFQVQQMKDQFQQMRGQLIG